MKTKTLGWLTIPVALLLLGFGCARSVAATPSSPGQAPPSRSAAQEEKPWLGVTIMQIGPQIAARWGLARQEGVVVSRVLRDSPAAKADIRARDIIIALNDAPITSTKELTDKVAAAKVGDVVSLTIIRGDEEKKLSVTLAARPAPRPGPLKELEGISLQDIFGHLLGGESAFTDKDGKRHTIKSTPGVVSSVGSDSITITPNGQTATVTFKVTSDTRISKGFRGAGLTDLKAGDKVTVVTVDGSQEARFLLAGEVGGRFLGMPWGSFFSLPFKMGPLHGAIQGFGRFRMDWGFSGPQRFLPQPTPAPAPGQALQAL